MGHKAIFETDMQCQIDSNSRKLSNRQSHVHEAQTQAKTCLKRHSIRIKGIHKSKREETFRFLEELKESLFVRRKWCLARLDRTGKLSRLPQSKQQYHSTSYLRFYREYPRANGSSWRCSLLDIHSASKMGVFIDFFSCWHWQPFPPDGGALPMMRLCHISQ